MTTHEPRDPAARAQFTARTLSEALPYIQRHEGEVMVIKYGGHAMVDASLAEGFARDVALLRQVGVNPVVVHGGGPMINEMLGRLGVETTFSRGKRVTDAATAEVVEMVLGGRVNARIVQAIEAQGGRAVGLSGKDASLMVCDPDDPRLGYVGRPAEMDTRVLETLFEGGLIPVIAPLGAGRSGESYNVNGDTAAGAIAGALRADRLLLLTDIAGVKDGEGRFVTELTPERIREMTESGEIAGGMIPKTQTILSALEAGVRAAVILDGRVPNAVLLELFTPQGPGSIVRGRA